MEIYYAEPKIIRFDVNETVLKNKIQPLGKLSVVVEPMCWLKAKPNDKILIMLRFRAHIINEKLNKEVLGYVFEFAGAVIPNEQETDLNDVIRFVQNSALNFQNRFLENAPIEIRHTQLTSEIDEKGLAKSLLELIYQ